MTERQPCSIARLPAVKAPRLSTAAAPAPFVARLTCVGENAPHSDECAAKPRLSVVAIRFDPFTRLDAKLLPLVASVAEPLPGKTRPTVTNTPQRSSPMLSFGDLTRSVHAVRPQIASASAPAPIPSSSECQGKSAPRDERAVDCHRGSQLWRSDSLPFTRFDAKLPPLPFSPPVRENAPHSDERAASDWIVAVCSRRVCATSPGCWPVNKVMSSAEPDIRSLSSSGRTGIGEPSRAPAAAEIDSQAFRPVGNASGTTHCGPARKHAAAAFLWHRGAF